MDQNNQGGNQPDNNLPAQQPNNAVVQLKQRKQTAQNLLMAYESQIKQCLPKFLTPERMIRVALTAMSRTPALLECTQASLISCVLTCAQLGLLPDGVIGEAYLIPFKNNKKGIMECTVIVGYKGLCTLAMRSGQVMSLHARAVYEGDFFEYEFGLDDKCVHRPSGETDPNKISHFYAVVKMNNGGRIFNVMTRKEVEAVRDDSANYKFSKYKSETVWGKHFAEMGNKTVLRRLMKFVPLSPEINRAIGLDEAAEGGRQKTGVDILQDLPEAQQDAIYADVLDEEEADKAANLDQSIAGAVAKGDTATQATLEKMKGKP